MKTAKRKTGLTLVELLITIAVLAILTVSVITVGSRVRTQAEIRLAESTIGVLITALEQYYEYWNKFPDPNDPGYTTAEVLYRELYSTPNSRRICEQISSLQIRDKNENNKPEFYVYDPWDNPLRYEYDFGERWNFPLITSAGPDGNFETEWDNITSKGR